MAEQNPERVTLTDVDTNEFITAQFNPDEVKEKVSVVFSRMKVLGQGGQERHYEGTENMQIDMEFGFDALSNNGTGRLDMSGAEGIEDARRFLLSLCYPRKQPSGIDDGGSANILFVWPKLYTLIAQIMSIEITHKQFASSGASVLFAAKITFEVTFNKQLTREDVRTYGTQFAA